MPHEAQEMRRGLRDVSHMMRRRTRQEIARSERAMIAIAQGRYMRRLGDPRGVVRVPEVDTLRIDPWHGPVVDVRGYDYYGEEDAGLRCSGCPVSDLVAVENGSPA